MLTMIAFTCLSDCRILKAWMICAHAQSGSPQLEYGSADTQLAAKHSLPKGPDKTGRLTCDSCVAPVWLC